MDDHKTVAATRRFSDSAKLIAEIYDGRLRFLMGLKTWHIFGGGWGRRVRTGKTAALGLWSKYKAQWAPPLTNDQRGLA